MTKWTWMLAGLAITATLSGAHAADFDSVCGDVCFSNYKSRESGCAENRNAGACLQAVNETYAQCQDQCGSPKPDFDLAAVTAEGKPAERSPAAQENTETPARESGTAAEAPPSPR